MNRRDTMLGLLAFGMAQLGRAQQPAKAVRIAFIRTGKPPETFVSAFKKGMRDLGYVEGENLSIEYRIEEASPERLSAIVEEVVRSKVDVIIASGAPPAVAAKKLKIAVPVVFVGVNGPLELGLISSLARPEGNITGLAITSADLAGKRLQLLREFIPKLRRVAVLWNPENPGNHVQMKAVEGVADVLKIDLQPLSITKPEELNSAFDRVRHAEALYVVDDPLFVAHRMRIAVLAANARMPTVNGYREMVEAGGMASYGVVLPDLYRRAATYVDKILRGAKPSDLPVEQPVKYELVINGQSLKALGLSVPYAVQVRADEVIQ